MWLMCDGRSLQILLAIIDYRLYETLEENLVEFYELR